MPCYRPVTCWKPQDGGPVSFSEVRDSREIQIKCGQCIGCRIAKRDMWAVRCYAESKMYSANSFVTLTYNEENYPQYGSLNYRDFQLFMHRLRKKCGPVRFFACGEYGEEFTRPHFHALLFGLDFGDKFQCNSVYSSSGPVFRSETLEKLWPKGFCTIGTVTFESARYCAAYICKKHSDDSKYQKVVPETGEIVQLEKEFCHMSLKPGIGATWLEKYWRDIYSTGHDGVFIKGCKLRPPVYFDEKMKESFPEVFEDVQLARELEAQKNALDNSRIRLEVREAVVLAKERFNKERRNG